jgi:3-dehydroquinate synthetase
MSGSDRVDHRLTVPGELGHPIAIGRDLAAWIADEVRAAGLEPPRRFLLVVDSKVGSFGESIGAALGNAGHRTTVAQVLASESRKDVKTLDWIWSAALVAGLGRRDAVVAVGGGVIGDLAGFAAATFLRGIALVAVPTTLLAMVDASTGGKCGINLALPRGGTGKNLAGAFHAPRLVAIDPGVLASLGERDFRSGLAECVKHAILDGEGHLAWLEGHRAAISRRDPEVLADLVARSVAVKAAIVGRDPFERGERALLNLGHTFGHALETMPGLDLTHGEAVGLGLVAASAAGGDPGFAARVAALVKSFGLPVALPGGALDRAEFDRRLGVDKKADAGGLRLVQPRAPGRVEVVPAERGLVERGLAALTAS